ncbi:hypothetical protein C457_05484 [Haloferax prahovense DSM 18310]|uniref:Uncharacterized protein n=3 Tax=Haloferax TaxID=2251 RepID=M0GWM1_HALGM|nr:hypothetical protein C457_05484 [Haloferax prahovense DSM 18310]ELZ76600.1 hypothetical protein C454_17563 [Haloferax gibbonsii ATCC 33959]
MYREPVAPRMSDDHDHGDHGHDDHHADEDARVTSPMQDFSMSQVTTGILVLVVGLVVVFGLPLALA